MPTTTERNEQITALYTDFADRLRRRVNTNVNTNPTNIEDACAYAWTQLIDRPHVDPAGESARGWLYVTAWREAIRLDRRQRDRFHAPAPAVEQPDPAQPDPAGQYTGDLAERDQRARDLRQLKAREQRELLLQAAGYSYDEIAQMTASTRTAVNRRLSEGRAHLNRLAEQRRARP